MQVTAALVSKSHQNVLFPALTVNLGPILSPLKVIIFSKSLLQLGIEIIHRLKMIWGMMHGA
jgi:hypothetical protein